MQIQICPQFGIAGRQKDCEMKDPSLFLLIVCSSSGAEGPGSAAVPLVLTAAARRLPHAGAGEQPGKVAANAIRRSRA